VPGVRLLPIEIILVQYELYELYDWGKVPELYGTYSAWTWNFMELLRILSFALLDNLSSLYIPLLRFLCTTQLLSFFACRNCDDLLS